MANTETATPSTDGNGKAKRIPIRMEVAEEFFDDIPEPVTLRRGKGQDLGVFQQFVLYLENGHHNNGKGKLTRIRFVGSDSAKQKAAQLRTALVQGKYPVPDGWEWNVAARPIVEDGKSVGSELYFQTSKKLAKSAKGKATSSDEIKTRTRKPKAETTEASA